MPPARSPGRGPGPNERVDSRGGLCDGARAQRRGQRREVLMAFNAAEPHGGAREPQADPTPNHPAIAPALDVARDVAHRADYVLDTVGRREEALQPRR